MTTTKSILSRLTMAVGGTDRELFDEQELNRFALFYLGEWEMLYNPNFNCTEFDTIKKSNFVNTYIYNIRCLTNILGFGSS